MESEGRSSSSRLATATKAVSYNVLLQLLLRVGSFIVNGVTLRYVDPELLGVANLRLTLLYDTILFLSREPLRKAALSKSEGDRTWRYIFNLLWIAIPLGLVLSVVLSLVWLSELLPQPNVRWDTVGVAVYVISALIELPSEPLWVLAQVKGHVTVKVMAEGMAQGVRCVMVMVGVVSVPQYGLLVFAIAQLMCSITYLAVYYCYFTVLLVRGRGTDLPITGITDILPHNDEQQFVSRRLLVLSRSFFKQSILKQVLTKGEQFVMTLFGVLTFTEQGVYDVINNLGSLVARFIFLPIEESFYTFFATTLTRGQPADKQSKDSVAMAGRVLSLLLKLVLLIALIILSFGYAYSHLALDLYGGSVLSSGSGPTLLRWYCVYVLFLAGNGITECFMFAAMSQQQVDRYNGSMLIFSAVFLGAAAVLTRYLGSVGFIIANCINMSSRILYSCRFINSFFNSSSISPLSSATPSLTVWVALTAAVSITTLSELIFCCAHGYLYRLIHVLIGCVCLVGVALSILISEHELCAFLMDLLPEWLATRVRGVLRLIPGTHVLHHKRD